MTINVDAEYLEELEEKAKRHDFFEGYIKGIEVAFAFAEELVKSISNCKTENNSEKPNNSTSSKMEQVDKDINVRSKDEPQTKCDTCETYWNCQGQCDEMPQIEDEPKKIYCPKCGRSDYIKDLEKDFGVKDGTFKYKCINCNTYIKDEPMTDCGDFANRLAYERGVKHAWEVAQKVFDSTVTFYEAEDVAKQITKDEPQTDCAWR